jgi:uncharacterized protein YqgQ
MNYFFLFTKPLSEISQMFWEKKGFLAVILLNKESFADATLMVSCQTVGDSSFLEGSVATAVEYYMDDHQLPKNETFYNS